LKPLPLDVDASPFLAPNRIPHFTGRVEELEELGSKLTQMGTRRVIALVGMGGIGKSAMTIELAHALRDVFPDGVLWANAANDDPKTVAERWANAYGFDFSRIPELDERAAVLRDLLQDKQVLIIFDDVISSTWVRLFIPDSDQCAVMLTMRNANLARVFKAHVMEVGELSLADGRSLLADILTGERVAAEEETAVQIVQLLQGLPLALSLAAQRLAALRRRKLSWLAERLQAGMAEHGQALEASFAISWEGLDESHQQIFAYLAVFAGRDFDVNALAAVAELKRFPAHDRLDMLVTLSLLNEEEDGRFRQHSLLALFAKEKLGDDDAPFRRMITYYSGFARDNQKNYVALKPEWENLSASIVDAHKLEMWLTVIGFAEALREAWFARGRYTEARKAFQRANEAAEILSDRQAVARCLLHWGHACTEQNAYEEAEKLLIASQQHFVELEDLAGIATAKYDLARIALELARNEEAEKLLDESRHIRESIGDAKGVAQTLYRQARIVFRRGQYDKAKSLGQQALDLLAKGGYERDSIPIYRLLTTIVVDKLDLDSAQKYSQVALHLCHKYQNQSELAVALLGSMRVYREKAEYERAIEVGLQSVEMLTQMGDRRSLGVAYHGFCTLYIKMEQWEQAVAWGERALKGALDVGDQLLQVLASMFLGDSYNCLNDHDRANILWTEALQIAQKLNHAKLCKKLRKRLDN
jgi:tetratricopeptide (TPR) repeat protein